MNSSRESSRRGARISARRERRSRALSRTWAREKFSETRARAKCESIWRNFSLGRPSARKSNSRVWPCDCMNP